MPYDLDWTTPENARFMALGYKPVTQIGRDFCIALARSFAEAESGRKYQRGVHQRKAFEAAAGAVVSDLLKAAQQTPERWSWRSIASGSFTDESISYRQFRNVQRSLETLGWIEKRPGNFNRIDWGDGARSGFGIATRFRATQSLIEFVAGLGLTPANIDTHFRQSLPMKPLVLRGPSVRVLNRKVKGRSLRYERTPTTEKLQRDILDLNLFLSSFEIVGGVHRAYRRIFNQGDLEGYHWNQGGRLYSMGEDNYQTLKKEERLKMTIGGMPVVEIDIRASYLTILHALKGVTFDSSRDPYKIPEAPEIPREVMKAWVTMTLGHTEFHTRWPSEKVKDFKKEGINLSKAFPLRVIRPKILQHLPILEDWPSQSVTCFDLMYLEAEAMVGTMLQLMREYETPSLSVHDSIIVPKSAERLASGLLRENYKASCGVEPHLVTP